jgi:flagellar biosynthesis protein FlhF
MQVKSFTGTSAPEVLAQVKAELGSDAIILGNRSFRKGGVLCHEVTAGIERPGKNGNEATGGSTPPGWSEWHKDWMLIKNQIHALMKPALCLDRLSPRQRQALEYLQREGANDDVILELYRRIVAEPDISLLEPLDAMMPVRPWSRALWKKRLHILAGPFGAGKTVSALRMALLLREEDPELKIAFINVDCARGTGRLVLRHWAELSDFAYHEAPEPDAMRRALSACGQADYIFVDMPGAGRGELPARQIAELGLNAADAATHIALAPHYDPVQTAAFLARYRGAEQSSLIWTKLDEAVTYGTILNTGHMSGLPVSALSYGPGLRGSMVPAEATLLRRLIFKRRLPGENPESPTPRATE